MACEEQVWNESPSWCACSCVQLCKAPWWSAPSAVMAAFCMIGEMVMSSYVRHPRFLRSGYQTSRLGGWIVPCEQRGATSELGLCFIWLSMTNIILLLKSNGFSCFFSSLGSIQAEQNSYWRQCFPTLVPSCSLAVCTEEAWTSEVCS